eukprot:NODE_9105_length_488_cov_2.794989_g8030_i0.p3 GENE.NODE_9105_length_488_cov_2.794989_g8030_i0~~NODE_9105_length_488_cov_2.794989_g8030_i0.p3  ORF type:complete len:80 (+),score=2.30 NODE_9105_length_488_cov_2.794989_g8030_i0:85-324(+)
MHHKTQKDSQTAMLRRPPRGASPPPSPSRLGAFHLFPHAQLQPTALDRLGNIPHIARRGLGTLLVAQHVGHFRYTPLAD